MSLKIRLIPVVLFSLYNVVTTVRFSKQRNGGSPVASIKQYARQKVDELIFLDINACRENRGPLFEIIEDVVEESLMPLTVGGGIKSREDIERLLKLGADKISINTQAQQDPSFIKESSRAYGNQCIVVSVDIIKHEDGAYHVCSAGGQICTGEDPVSYCRRMEELGAGEILLTSIDCNGSMKGYDLPLCRIISDNITVPVIINGGAGNYQHFVDGVLEGHASAVAASSIFQYTQHNPIGGRAFMKEKGLDVR